MKRKYYINRAKHYKTLRISSVIGLLCLVVLILLNVFFYHFSGLIVASSLLGGAVFISCIALYRTLFLFKLPLIIIDNDAISYFNVLWYNKHKWTKFELAFFDAEIPSVSIGLTNGRIFDKFLLDSLSQQDIDEIINHFIAKDKLAN